ncbi:MAG: SdrD B-like domain-containing protein, partial [Actinomycetota bacterium]
MLRLKKPLLLLLALSVVGAGLTSAQAMDELFAGRRRDQDRRVRNNPGDDGVAFAQLRERLQKKWRDDLEAARRKRKRLNLGQSRRKKRKEGIQAPVAASGQYVYFPSGNATDAKFLVLAGPVGTGTLVNELNIKLAAPSTASSVDIAIFDGDMTGAWDQGTGNLTYTLYRDPNADGTGTDPVPGAQWLGSQMTDNAWTALTDSGSVNGGVSVPVDAGAQAPSGNYFYILKIQLSGTSAGTAACMKFRTNASVRLEPQNSFTIIGALGSTADLNRVYPSYPSLTPTTYDGIWDLFTYVPQSLEYDPLDNSRPTAFEVWDGDFDFGAASLATNDTDDANTPNSVSLLPDWASSTSPVAEGVAVGRNGATGAPQDDAASLLFQRAPSVRYDVTDPSGVRYFNPNPSGNQEWERFRIETNPFTKNSPSVADAAASGANLPAGVYQVHIEGVDLANLNALRFEHDILGVDEHGNPVQPLLPYNLGDTVWLDADGDGTQNGGELGIAGVNVTLLDDSGNVLLTDVTDASGLYSFNVAAGTYTVRVEASNFVSGSPLAGLNSTTGGQEITGTVSTANVLTFDYGYRGAPSGSIGDFVWLDIDGDGVQDDGEPGIGGVTVTLGGDASGTTTTDVNGFYLFTGLDTLAAHNYTVTVSGDPLSGLTQTFDSDGVASALNSTVTVAIGSNDLAQDFGFRGTGRIGDLIWLDANGDNTYTLGVD